MLTWGAWVIVALIFVGGFVLVKDWAPADVVFLGATALLVVTGILPIKEAISNFANEGMLTVGVMYAMAKGISATGALNYFVTAFLGKPSTEVSAQFRLLSLVIVVSAFVYNTPVVVVFIPIVEAWSNSIGISQQQLLIPLSFTAMFGGFCTTIGSSTNLIVVTKAKEVYPNDPVTMFDVGTVGLPVAMVGFAYVLLFTRFLLPRSRPDDVYNSDGVVKKVANGVIDLSASVNSDSPLIKTLLRNANKDLLDSVRVKKVTKADGRRINVETTTISAGDIIVFQGVAEVVSRVASDLGLSLQFQSRRTSGADIEGQSLSQANSPRVESIRSGLIHSESVLVGKVLNAVNIPNATILSVYRDGESVLGNADQSKETLKIGDVVVFSPAAEFSFADAAVASSLRELTANLESGVTSSADIAALGNSNQFVVSFRVRQKSRILFVKSLDGKSIKDLGLSDNVKDKVKVIGISVYDAALGKAAEYRTNFTTDDKLHSGDLVWFLATEKGLLLLRQVPGLEPVDDSHIEKLKVQANKRRLVEAVIGAKSPLLGNTLEEVRFRSNYGAAVLAIRRASSTNASDADFTPTVDKPLTNIGDVKLQQSDVLLLEAGPNFVHRFEHDSSFLLVREISGSTPLHFGKFYIALFAWVAMIAAYIATGSKTSLFALGILALGIMLLGGVLTPQQARDSLDWSVLITIGASNAFSAAMETTGLAQTVAQGLVDFAVWNKTGEVGILASIYFATMFVGLFISNNSAALLMFPIAKSAGTIYGIPPMKVIFDIIIAANSDFSTPYGYQTNMMVAGIGGYTFKDFIRYGVPLQLLLVPVTTVAINYVESWYYITAGAALILLISTLIAFLLPSNNVGKNINGQPLLARAASSFLDIFGGGNLDAEKTEGGKSIHSPSTTHETPTVAVAI